MTKLPLIAAVLAAGVLSAPPADAGGREQLLLLVEQDLREFGIRGVDVNSLSTHRLAAIHQIAHLDRPRGGKRALIQSEIGGRNTLRGLLGL